MKTGKLILTVVLGLTGLAGQAAAEYKFFTPKGSFAVEVSLENPGPGRLRLPIYRNAITSLAVLGDYAIGGTSAEQGLAPFVFRVSLSSRNLEEALDLEKILPGQRSVQSGFARGKEGELFAGTMPGREGAGGHLIKVRLSDGSLQVTDLGIPVAAEGIFSLAADPERGVLYGITYHCF